MTVDGRSYVTSGESILGFNSLATGTATLNNGTWCFADDFYAGYNGTGVVHLSNGGTLQSHNYGDDVYLGFAAGSHGTVTVDGDGSYLGGMFGLYVGYDGTGDLDVTAAGTISQDYGSAALGDAAGSDGTVTVDGTGSTWTGASMQTIGRSGSGTLNITGGGYVAAEYASVGQVNGSQGAVTVDGTGSTWYIAYDTNGFGDLDGTLLVGTSGTGTLDITRGGCVTTGGGGSIGNGSSGTGTVTVDGSGSTWTAGDISVGSSGTGTLNITGGGHVTNGSGSLANVWGQFDAEGTVTVDGQGSTWTNNESLSIAGFGAGTVNITDGGLIEVAGYTSIGFYGGQGSIHFDDGTLTTGSLMAAAADLDGTGTVNAHGLVTDADLVFDASHGLVQQLTLDEQPSQSITVNLDVDGTGRLGAGGGGTGSLTIRDGMDVASTTGYLGFLAGSSGTATVNGAGSTWTSGSMYTGYDGNGTLHISNGGEVSTTSGVIALGAASVSTVTVDDPGSDWTNAGEMMLGRLGTGSLEVTNGGIVSNTSAYLGMNALATGTATVSGLDSVWTSSGDLYVGGCTTQYTYYDGAGTGVLHIASGGTVDVGGDLYIGARNGSNGTVDLAGGALRLHGGELIKGGGAASFNFTGGRLEGVGIVDLGAPLLQIAGTLAPGNSAGATQVEGGYIIDAGTLEIEINGHGAAGTNWDLLYVNGAVDLLGTNGLADGVLEVILGFAPSPGDEFLILANDGADPIVGTFAGGSSVTALYDGNLYQLTVDYSAGDGNDVVLIAATAALSGDYNLDGVVDAADYTVWRDALGATVVPCSGPDGSGDGTVDEADYAIWKAHFGEASGSGVSLAQTTNVPEPASAVLLVLGCVVAGMMRHRRA